MHKRTAIVWFRLDLRLHDNEALSEALNSAEEVIPVYVFDERKFKGTTRFGFPKIGNHRAQFIIESVKELRANLRKLGSDLYVRVGQPEEELFSIARKVKSSWIFCNRERMDEELKVQDSLEQKLWSIGQELRYSRGKLLYYTADLPFPITHTPDSFTLFKKEVERYVPVRQPIPTPERIPPTAVALASGDIPSLEDFGISPLPTDKRDLNLFKGGESTGLQRLNEYLWESHAVLNYKHSKNEMLGIDYSSKFSPWLALGCLSPKMIYHELKKFDEQYGTRKNKSIDCFFLELMQRDFYRLMGKKHGSKIFYESGIRGIEDREREDNQELFMQWVNGETGVPFIDAHMRQIKHTGYMSNRGRQNVSSFLINDLGLNWVMGADYFESQLIDYDVCSNYCNWGYAAGVGSDPKEYQNLNIISQAKRFDPNGEYVKYWLPELSMLPAQYIHQPDQLSYKEQEDLHFMIGDDYPKALVSTDRWAS